MAVAVGVSVVALGTDDCNALPTAIDVAGLSVRTACLLFVGDSVGARSPVCKSVPVVAGVSVEVTVGFLVGASAAVAFASAWELVLFFADIMAV